MPLFEYTCPGCGKPTVLDPAGACQNPVKGGKCGWEFPLKVGSGNSFVTEKMKKHTSPRPEGETGAYSWVDETGKYVMYQLDAAKNGSVCLDPKNNYLFLWSTPSGSNQIGKVLYGTGIDVVKASGVVLPLNSKLKNMHVHFDNFQDRFVPIATGPNVSIQQPNPSHPNEFHVLSGEEVVYRYDFVRKTSV